MLSIARTPHVAQLIDLALAEDLGRGDVTTESVLGGDRTAGRAVLVAREPLVVCGLDVAAQVFERVNASIQFAAAKSDGDSLAAGDVAAKITGPAGAILIAERTALNFMQRLSGVATQASRYVKEIEGTGAKVVDTRKTTPGYRVLEKAAVRAGGGRNHRADLGSGVLIKDNHIAACGSVDKAVSRALAAAPHSLRIEVEVDTLTQLEEAISAGAHIVLLDNMSVDDVKTGAERAHAAGLVVEVSGGITLETIGNYARAGADIISVGALTHSATAVDLALDWIDG
jgi:nicotinate-nucleotide pyrophosphorylase (carboxylating)